MHDEDRGPVWPTDEQRLGSVWPAPMPGQPPPPMPTQLSAAGYRKRTGTRKRAPEKKAAVKRKSAAKRKTTRKNTARKTRR